MGWRDFLNTTPVEFMESMESMTETIGTAKQEFMENMESMPVPAPLIPLIPFIPPVVPTKNGLLCQHTEDWRPEPKAWLEGDALLTSGVADDLAGEIIKLTAGDLPLQRRLLKLHIGTYSGPWWGRLVERWQERAGIMQFEGGLTKDDAEYQAAVCLRADMFLEELRSAP